MTSEAFARNMGLLADYLIALQAGLPAAAPGTRP